MTDIQFDFDWDSYPDDDRRIGETTARLKIHVDGTCLTRNHDICSETIQDHVIVSLYPIAMWFASSWWRLNHEIRPAPADVRSGLAHDWRMSHELAAANMGFVWPNLVLAPDEDEIRVWAQASPDQGQATVKYLNGLSRSRTLPREQFASTVSMFIEDVIVRLNETGLQNSELAQLWALIAADRENPKVYQKRRIEAELGFDPEECPNSSIKQAISLEKKIGTTSFSELAGAYAGHTEDRLKAMKALADSVGIIGKPDIPSMVVGQPEREPWKLAVSYARELRKQIANSGCVLSNDTLYDLLGLPKQVIESWMPTWRAKASVAESPSNETVKFVPRKKHPVGKRFELARFIGDYTRAKNLNPESWLVTADLSTARQRFQRAFAAEFLCPITSLVEYLGGDFSETAVEEASSYFEVSERTVESLLMNNGYIESAPYGDETLLSCAA